MTLAILRCSTVEDIYVLEDTNAKSPFCVIATSIPTPASGRRKVFVEGDIEIKSLKFCILIYY